MARNVQVTNKSKLTAANESNRPQECCLTRPRA